MAKINRQRVTSESGAAITFTAASAGGDTVDNDLDALILVKNDGAATRTITVTPVVSTFQSAGAGILTRGNIVMTVAVGAIGALPMPPAPFKNSTTGLVTLTYDAVTSVTVAVVSR